MSHGRYYDNRRDCDRARADPQMITQFGHRDCEFRTDGTTGSSVVANVGGKVAGGAVTDVVVVVVAFA
jgi:hypothetical protein